VWERLDRYYATPHWISLFPEYTVRHLSRITSDHSPILLSLNANHKRAVPFRFDKFWISYPKAKDIAREMWRMPVRGNAAYRIYRRLDLLKRRLLWWNRVDVGNLLNQIKSTEASILLL